MIPAKPFYMIRHGQTEANLVGALTGQSETPLTDLGREQARALRKVLRLLEPKPSAIVYSNLSRARETAEIVNEALDLEMFEEKDIGGRNLGFNEGKTNEQCVNKADPENGESYKVFYERMKGGISRALTTHDTPVFLVSHNGAFRSMGGLYGFSLKSKAKNCTLYEFRPNPDNTSFPWDVYSYDLDEAQNRVIRTHEELYHKVN